ncbi:oligopeptide:H+ symporter [Lentisphaerota bacterium ZTH]|nr:MFS transporter [Lentisphaerota bacterium]WET05990.1 oligopeptide:H+ symporter [Lentisphaerota bacterium ZTH]
MSGFGVLKQPKPFYLIFFLEFWERFGYYGVQAIVTLYFVKHLGYSEQQSFAVFGSFFALVFGLAMVGGWLGDKVIGTKRTIILGMLTLLSGYSFLTIANKETIFIALAMIVAGNGLFKANPSSLLSKCYERDDVRLDGAFTMYYMAINLGSFVSMSVTPLIASRYGWNQAFSLSAIGLACALLNYWVQRKSLLHVKSEAGDQQLNLKYLGLTIAGIIGSVFVISSLLKHATVTNIAVAAISLGGIGLFLKNTFQQQGKARARMLVALVLIVQGVIFFVLYGQMPTSLTFFAVHNVNNHLLGLNINPASYQVLNPLIILLASPLLAVVYAKVKMSHPTKFALGMTFCAGAFLLMYFVRFAATNNLVSPAWMVGTYMLQSIGELLVSALGVAMVAQLCPRNMAGFAMGVWFLTSMIAGPISAKVASFSSPAAGAAVSAETSLLTYSNVFTNIGLFTCAVAALMWLAVPVLNRLIRDEEAEEPESIQNGEYELEQAV